MAEFSEDHRVAEQVLVESKRPIHEQLLTQCFAVFEIPQKARVEAIRRGLEEISAHHGFRFPPINVERIHYESVHREAFQALFEVAIDALSAIKGSDQSQAAELNSLFGDSADDPFPHGHPYHSTFFNLFNYDHGSLNEHLDRGLITVIFVDPAPIEASTFSNQQLSAKQVENTPSALWIKGADDIWRSGDKVIRQLRKHTPHKSYVLILIGEEGELEFKDVPSEGFENLSASKFFAAAHCVRADPLGEFIERSHYRCDPEARPNQNRKSAALILKRLAQSEN